MPFDACDLGGKMIGRQLITLVMEMNSGAKQDLHGPRPSGGGTGFPGGLQIASLMGQTELAVFGGRFQL